MWLPATPCGQDGVASHPFLFLDLFLIFYDFVFNLLLKIK
jgi:hypothetical protein